MSARVTFDLQIANDYYSKSANKDMVYKWERQEVYLEGIDQCLGNQIARLQAQIDAIPEPVSYPADATPEQKAAIDMFNQRDAAPEQKADLMRQRDKRQAFYDQLKAIPVQAPP